MKSQPNKQDIFLPNFCGLRMVFVVVIIAQLFSFVVVLTPLGVEQADRWQHLALVSLFVQWCALMSSAVLCVSRPWLRRFSNTQVAVISFCIVLLVVFVVSEAAYWLVYVRSNLRIEHAAFVVRNVVIAAFLTGPVLRYFYVQEQWRRNVRAEAQARLQALQSRIRPHFLFNSMNTIASLTRSNPAQAESAVENLADLFRASLRDARQFHSLGQEWELCRRYLEIEELRLGERLRVAWQIDQLPHDALVPPLLLQPLLENAIYHGIEPLPEGGEISIEGELRGDTLVITLSNPLPREADKQKQGHQLAQENIRERLAAVFGDEGKLTIYEKEQRYQVEVSFPYQREQHEDFDSG